MITGNDFLALARRLAAEDAEGAWRSAVSRAYYGAFHEARRLLRSLGFKVPQGEKAHAYLWRRLSNSGNLKLAATGLDLSHLRGLRNYADYEIDGLLSQTDALTQVGIAGNIVLGLETFAVTTALHPPVIAAIRHYEVNVLREVSWPS